MSLKDNSIHSASSNENFFQVPTCGSHKVKYNPESDWDFCLDVADEQVDLSLVLPHYRARTQPVNHRMNMFIGGEHAPVKAKVCRTLPQGRFYLDVQAKTSDITLWIPSDFKGRIQHTSSRVTYSAGFTNRILPNASVSHASDSDIRCISDGLDDIVVVTHGRISYRMWDVETGAVESQRKETLKRVFGMTRKQAQPQPKAIDWDFLLED